MTTNTPVALETQAAPSDLAPEQVPTRKAPRPAVSLVGMTAGLAAILVLLLALFILPSLKSGAHGLPLGLVGSPAGLAQAEESLSSVTPDAYATRHFDSEDELTTAIERRDVVGGLVLTDTDVRALVASAGSTAISGTVTATATQLAAASGAQLGVVDVVPLPEADPTGVGIGGLAFPLVFGGIVPVVAFASVFPRRNGWRLGGILAFSVVGGAVVAAVLQLWFGSVSGVFLPVAGSMALGIAALALPLAGLQKLFGGKGFTIGAMTMMFLGNPLAGIATTGAWLPAGLGAFGQLLPPGATGALVRSAAYFGGSGGLVPALTLAGWVVVGVLLTIAGMKKAAKAAPAAV